MSISSLLIPYPSHPLPWFIIMFMPLYISLFLAKPDLLKIQLSTTSVFISMWLCIDGANHTTLPIGSSLNSWSWASSGCLMLPGNDTVSSKVMHTFVLLDHCFNTFSPVFSNPQMTSPVCTFSCWPCFLLHQESSSNKKTTSTDSPCPIYPHTSIYILTHSACRPRYGHSMPWTKYLCFLEIRMLKPNPLWWY